MAIRVSNKWTDESYEIIKSLRGYRAKVAEYQASKEIYNEMFPCAVQQLSDMPGSRSDTFEPERWAARRISQLEKMQRSINDMLDEYSRIEAMTEQLEGYPKVVIMRRYIFNESFEEIACKIHFHSTTVRKMHDRAIESLKRQSPKTIRTE